VVTILLLFQLKMERALNQLPLMVQQPFTADNYLTIVASMETRHIDVERILVAAQRLGGNDPSRKLAAQISHQRIAQLLIQRAGPKIVIRNYILHVAGLINHAVAGEGIRD